MLSYFFVAIVTPPSSVMLLFYHILRLFSRNSLWIPGVEIKWSNVTLEINGPILTVESCLCWFRTKGEGKNQWVTMTHWFSMTSPSLFFDYRGAIFEFSSPVRHFVHSVSRPFQSDTLSLWLSSQVLKMRTWNAECAEHCDLTDKMSARTALWILSTIYPKSRFCTKRHKSLEFQSFSGVFKPFARKAEKGNCKFEPQIYKSVFEVWSGKFQTHKPLLRRLPYLWIQRRNI